MTPMLFVIALGVAAQVPPEWTCDDGLFGDDTCDCGCDARDSDCGGATFDVCVRDNCAPGESPWAEFNESCMASACGDGWADTEGEACDDADALASGGCNADCSAVNEGFTCGAGAAGCTADAGGEGEGEGEGEGDGGGEGEGEGDDDGDDPGNGGCSASTASPLGAVAVALLVIRRRRSRR